MGHIKTKYDKYMVTLDKLMFLLTQPMKAIGKMLLPQSETEQRRERTGMFSEKKRIAVGLREFFENNYELRYNVMKQAEEFRPRLKKDAVSYKGDTDIGKNQPLRNQEEAGNFQYMPSFGSGAYPIWQQLTDRELKKIALEEMEQAGVAWSVDIELYVRSALVPLYNPVSDYLEHCGTWDGQMDYIRQMARRVPTRYAAWPDHFHRWFLGMVAQWMNLSRDFGNSVVPMLIGGQGTHKSTFCKLLLPPELRDYYIDDIKLDNSEQVERMLGRMLLVNIDEYNAKTDREQAKIKRVLTEKDVQTRRMRSEQYVRMARMASFIATTNEQEPLCDPTGSRRYLCCEVEGIIDTDTPVNYGQMYAQAVHELNNGATFYFSKDEEAEIERHNQEYQQQSSVETVLLSYFQPAEPRKENFMKAVEIQEALGEVLRASDVPNIKRLTLALRASKFHSGKCQGKRGWYAVRIGN